jgi:hypothetical protein
LFASKFTGGERKQATDKIFSLDLTNLKKKQKKCMLAYF